MHLAHTASPNQRGADIEYLLLLLFVTLIYTNRIDSPRVRGVASRRATATILIVRHAASAHADVAVCRIKMMSPERRPYSTFSPVFWDIRCLDRNSRLRSRASLLSAKQASRAYPTRLLRYWFIYHLLRIEYQQSATPLSICEVGIDSGQMLKFMRSVTETPGISPVQCSSWVGVDCCIKRDALAGIGYTRYIEADIEHSEEWLNSEYDALILLHVMEHLYEPEKVFGKIASRMKPNSVIVGGFPSVPHWCVKLREPTLRANPDPGSHRSAFSPQRVKDIARAHGLHLDFLAGAFLVRASGWFLEDYAWWLRFNVLFGALIPSWPGEIYWVMRKSIPCKV